KRILKQETMIKESRTCRSSIWPHTKRGQTVRDRPQKERVADRRGPLPCWTGGIARSGLGLPRDLQLRDLHETAAVVPACGEDKIEHVPQLLLGGEVVTEVEVESRYRHRPLAGMAVLSVWLEMKRATGDDALEWRKAGKAGYL